MCSVYAVCVVLCCRSRGTFLCAMCVVIVIIQVVPLVLAKIFISKRRDEHVMRYCITV